jgi:starch synthase
MGVDARVILPGYGFIDHTKHKINHLMSFQLPLQEGTAEVQVYTTIHDGVPYYFVQSFPYFGNEHSVYTDRSWDVPRFINFNQLVMSAIWELRQAISWFPEVVNVNDWHTGLLPFLIEENRNNPEWSKVSTVLSIHNLAYQGDQIGGWLWKAGISGRHQSDLIYQDLSDNMLAIAIAYADILTTVSPRYAIEIQYPSMGYGLDSLIRTRVADLYGILNGIDAILWDPATDVKLISNFDATDFVEKRHTNKYYLQETAGLEIRDNALLIGMISRLVWQKGIDLALPALRRMLASYDVQFVMLGTGDPDLENDFRKLGEDFYWKSRCYLKYDDAIAQQIYAGCDLFLMPSHYEPCGIGQMMAMRYGALPLVRDTGGLADTVDNYDNLDGERGSGFLFLWEEPEAVFGTLQWALKTYTQGPDAWRNMQRNAMQKDFSWDNSARQYIDLYQKSIQSRKG